MSALTSMLADTPPQQRLFDACSMALMMVEEGTATPLEVLRFVRTELDAHASAPAAEVNTGDDVVLAARACLNAVSPQGRLGDTAVKEMRAITKMVTDRVVAHFRVVNPTPSSPSSPGPSSPSSPKYDGKKGRKGAAVASDAARLSFVLTAESDLPDDCLALLDLLCGFRGNSDIVAFHSEAVLHCLVELWPTVSMELTPRWARCVLVVCASAARKASQASGKPVLGEDDSAAAEEAPVSHFTSDMQERLLFLSDNKGALTRLIERAIPALLVAGGLGGLPEGIVRTMLPSVRQACTRHDVTASLEAAYTAAHYTLHQLSADQFEVDKKEKQGEFTPGGKPSDYNSVTLSSPSLKRNRAESTRRPGRTSSKADQPVRDVVLATDFAARKAEAYAWMAPHHDALTTALKTENAALVPAPVAMMAVGYQAMRWGAGEALHPCLGWHVHEEGGREPLSPDEELVVANDILSKRRVSSSEHTVIDLERLTADGDPRARVLPCSVGGQHTLDGLGGYYRAIADGTLPSITDISLEDVANVGFMAPNKTDAPNAALCIQARMLACYYRQRAAQRLPSPDPDDAIDEEHVIAEVLWHVPHVLFTVVLRCAEDLASCAAARPEVWGPALADVHGALEQYDSLRLNPVDANDGRDRKTTNEAIRLLLNLAETHRPNQADARDNLRAKLQTAAAIQAAARKTPFTPKNFTSALLPRMARNAAGLLALSSYFHTTWSDADVMAAVEDARSVALLSKFVADACRAITNSIPDGIGKEKDGDVIGEAHERPFLVRFCDSRELRRRHCPAGHPLRLFRGDDWGCSAEGCGTTSELTALACRSCGFHICRQCAQGGGAMYPAADPIAEVDGTVLPRRGRDEMWYVVDPATKRPVSVPLWWTVVRAAVVAGTDDQGFVELHRTDASGCSCGKVSAADEIETLERPSEQDPRLFYAALSCSRLTATLASRALTALATSSQLIVSGLDTFGFARLAELLRPAVALSMRKLLLDADSGSTEQIAISVGRDAGTTSFTRLLEGRAGTIKVERNDSIIERISHGDFLDAVAGVERLSVEFAGEAGFGKGPTQEFFIHLFEQAYLKPDLWATATNGAVIPVGFEVASAPAAGGRRTATALNLGIVLGRALHDGFLVPTRLHPVVWKVLFAGPAPTFGVLAEIMRALDEPMAEHILALPGHSADSLEMLCLETDSGDDVTVDNVAAYVDAYVRRVTMPAYRGMMEFRAGFCAIMSPTTLNALFDPTEMSKICGGHNDSAHFTPEALRAAIKPSNGYTWASPQLPWLVEELSSLDADAQRRFIEFLTGSECLPAGGWRALGKPLTVVRKDFEGSNERTLPSCSTCFIFLKLPPYPTKEMLSQCLAFACNEGRQNFALS